MNSLKLLVAMNELSQIVSSRELSLSHKLLVAVNELSQIVSSHE